MNWTEGSLARHSKIKRRGDDDARQRQHFARVRSRLDRRPRRPVALDDAASWLNLVPNHGVETGSAHPQARVEREARLGGSRRTSLADVDNLPTPSLAASHPESERRGVKDEDGDRHGIGEHRDIPGGGSLTFEERKKRLLEKPDWAGLAPVREDKQNYSLLSDPGSPVAGWLDADIPRPRTRPRESHLGHEGSSPR
ncbi:hypothetical protein HIM_06747 [Hirsutella minnesotensis 3608]|uniref:Uncharacterized protein n=1 Tax=Hirsutella minnesotensis 3608 TaxID=1043627 RepID=A0A0F8A4M8_9HYPO|nr:hypothetical protein HIM_06747 [Hirsutella minnesotensis 3608]